MDAAFWHARWQAQEIGFHQDAINLHLQQFWPELKLPAKAVVFVPLCGKSKDMLWLAAQGYRVIGVEISDIAVADFFAESGLKPQLTTTRQFKEYRCDELCILQGDFFDLTAKDLEKVTAVFDRAALIALPDTLRTRYAEHLKKILPQKIQSLLVTLNYAQAEMSGPPFAVTEAMVRHLFADEFSIQLLRSLAILEEQPRFKSRGLTQLDEQVYLLAR